MTSCSVLRPAATDPRWSHYSPRSDEIARWTRIPFPYSNSDYDAWLELDHARYLILRDEHDPGLGGSTSRTLSRPRLRSATGSPPVAGARV